jgi:hypothetical protein
MPIFQELRRIATRVVLFHCLDSSEETGGGNYSTQVLKGLGFREVIYPFREEHIEQNVALFHCANRGLLPLRRLDPECYRELKDSVKGFVPNTGFAAIWTIVGGKCSSLFVTGINFMRRPYNSGYHDHLESHQKAIELIERYGNHNPDLDLESFRQLVLIHPVELDDVLVAILAEPPQQLFYRRD